MMRRLLPALLLIMVCLIAVPPSAQAFDPFGRTGKNPSVTCGKDQYGQDQKEQQSTVCSTTNADPLTGPNGLFVKITRVVAFFAGVFAVIMIIVAAIRYITSGSDISTSSRTDTDVEDAKRTISSALIGIVVIVLAQAIITFVVSRL